ncbi:hematopoietic SH2 domain-containing protein homolog [Festucalex cinctus]
MTELSEVYQPLKNNWFVASQPTWIQDGVVPEWFYWRISRKTAEQILIHKPTGSFLIRVSESRAGYTLSYRAEGRVRHFMIDSKEDGSCAIVGEKGCHPSLQELVDFHRKVPIAAHNEVLTLSCSQAQNVERKYNGNSSVQSNKSHVISKEDQDHQNDDERRIHTHPAMPIPKTRKRYSRDSTLPVKPLETPSQNLPTPSNMKVAPTPEEAATSEVAPAPTLDHHDETDTKSNAPRKTEELQELTWQQLFDEALSAYNDEGLPVEYSPPPPFAPGYKAEKV